MQRQYARLRHFYGYKNDGSGAEIFKSNAKPSVESHGYLYAACVGPFKTNRAAIYMSNDGMNNPHCRTVADAERISKKL